MSLIRIFLIVIVFGIAAGLSLAAGMQLTSEQFFIIGIVAILAIPVLGIMVVLLMIFLESLRNRHAEDMHRMDLEATNPQHAAPVVIFTGGLNGTRRNGTTSAPTGRELYETGVYTPERTDAGMVVTGSNRQEYGEVLDW